MPKKYTQLNTTQVGKMLNLSTSHVRLLCKIGKIKAEKIGTEYIVNSKDLINLKVRKNRCTKKQ